MLQLECPMVAVAKKDPPDSERKRKDKPPELSAQASKELPQCLVHLASLYDGQECHHR